MDVREFRGLVTRGQRARWRGHITYGKYGAWNLLQRLPLDIFGRGLLQKLAIAVGSRAHVAA